MHKTMFLVLLVLYFLKQIHSQEITTTQPQTVTLPPQNSTSTRPTPSEDGSISGDVSEVVLNTSSGTNIPYDSNVKNKIPTDVFQKFHWLRPVQEQFDKLREFLAYTKHPNYGGVQFLNPQDVWERLHEKGHHLLTGVHGAVFGLANVENHDYPFAYRELKKVEDRH